MLTTSPPQSLSSFDMSANAVSQPIHVAITRRIKPGCEQEFETALKEFFDNSLAQTGVQGAVMLVPPPGSSSTEYGIIRSFASAAERDSFYASPLYVEWKNRVAPLSEGEPKISDLHGLEAFFRISGANPPPRWKMAIATYIGVEIVTIPLALTLGRAVSGWSLWAANPLQNIFVVGLLTWVVMPVITKALSGWLRNNKGKTI